MEELGGKAVKFFFFKQKTAYEVGLWLEFRRVLFRSKQSNSKLIKELDNLKKRFDAAIGKKKAEKKWNFCRLMFE